MCLWRSHKTIAAAAETMALTKCRECGHDLSTAAKTCPNCGARSVKKNSTLALVLLILVIVFVGLPFLGKIKRSAEPNGGGRVKPSSVPVTQSQVLREELSYLSDIPEVAWIEVEKNSVYVGFSLLPNDWEMIIKGAALRGNKATNFGCHVWAVDADKKGWRPGDSPFYGEFTARYGKLE